MLGLQLLVDFAAAVANSLDSLLHGRLGTSGCIVGACHTRFDDVEICGLELRNGAYRSLIKLQRLIVADILEATEGRQSYSDAVGAGDAVTATMTSLKNRMRLAIEPPYRSVR